MNYSPCGISCFALTLNTNHHCFGDRMHGQKYGFKICLLPLAFLANTATLMSLENELFMKDRLTEKFR